MTNFESFKEFLPNSVKEFDYTQISLDSSDLSIADVLRNLNKLYPKNSRSRNKIIDGELVVGVMCKTETIYPYSGIFLIIGQKDIEIDISTKSYIVLIISEERISTDLEIRDLMDDISRYLVNNYNEVLRDLPDFYRKYVYNEDELYEDEDYQSNEY